MTYLTTIAVSHYKSPLFMMRWETKKKVMMNIQPEKSAKQTTKLLSMQQYHLNFSSTFSQVTLSCFLYIVTTFHCLIVSLRSLTALWQWLLSLYCWQHQYFADKREHEEASRSWMFSVIFHSLIAESCSYLVFHLVGWWLIIIATGGWRFSWEFSSV